MLSIVCCETGIVLVGTIIEVGTVLCKRAWDSRPPFSEHNKFFVEDVHHDKGSTPTPFIMMHIYNDEDDGGTSKNAMYPSGLLSTPRQDPNSLMSSCNFRVSPASSCLFCQHPQAPTTHVLSCCIRCSRSEFVGSGSCAMPTPTARKKRGSVGRDCVAISYPHFPSFKNTVPRIYVWRTF